MKHTRLERWYGLLMVGGVLLGLAVGADGARASEADAASLVDRVEHGYANSDGVKIHYVSIGEGPLVVMIHGFPDYWYTWRHQMAALSENHRVVAIDTRGYNRSDQPKGVAAYAMPRLVADVLAVIDHLGSERAVIVGHDWGGSIAWNFAMSHPDRTDRLIVLNLPHPNGLSRELATNREQRENSQYARNFQQPDSHEKLSAAGLAMWVRDPAARARYVEAFERSSLESMMNYYRANYPKTTAPAAHEGKTTAESPMPGSGSSFPNLKMPVLLFHGLKDPYLLHQALNGTWEWIDADLTLVTIPDAGHFVQHDAADLVTRSMKMWLAR